MAGCGATGEQHIQVISGTGNPHNTGEQHIQVNFRSWESPQTLLPRFIGPFEHVERFRNLKFAVIRITDIQSAVLSSSKGTAAIHLAFK